MTRDPPRLTRAAPYFPVADLAVSQAHYERVLGFRTEYAGGDPPVFAILSRDGLAIMLRSVDDPHRIRPIDRQGGTWDAFFWVSDAEALADELRAAGAELVYGPRIQEYGMNEFAVRDVDGHVLGFGQPVAT